MSSVNSTASSTSTTSTTATSNATNSISDVSVSTFIKLLCTELSNQDPTEPTSNAEILNQVSQITAISSNNKLSTTLSDLSGNENVATACGMIGKKVEATDDDGNDVTGTVDSVTISNGTPSLIVGSSTVSLENISAVSSSSST